MLFINCFTLTAEKEYSINFTEQHEKFCLSMHYNEANSYLFLNGVKTYKFQAKDSDINAAPLYLGNVSKDFLVDNMEKTLKIIPAIVVKDMKIKVFNLMLRKQ